MTTDQPTGQPVPDPYREIAAGLRDIADKLDTLAQTGTPAPQAVNIYLPFGYTAADSALTVPAVNAIADAFGVTAVTKFEGRGKTRRGERTADYRPGPVRVRAYTAVPVPPTKAQTVAELRAENDRLRAQLGGGEQA